MQLLTVKNECQKGNHRRDTITIIAEILIETNIERNKRDILNHCNLNYKQLKLYTELLLKKRLLSIHINEKCQEKFLTTPKGNDFIKTFSDLIDVLIPHNKTSAKNTIQIYA